MSSKTPRQLPKYFWGNTPDEQEYYTSQSVRNHQSYFETPHGRLFTQSFHPINPSTGQLLPVKALVFMTHGYASDSSWLFQKIAISFAQWGYAVYCHDLLGHGRSDGLRGYIGDVEAVAAASLSFLMSVRYGTSTAYEYEMQHFTKNGGTHSSLPAFLFGESLGGAITLLMYLRSDPGVWTGLIFAAPIFIMPEALKPPGFRRILHGFLFGIADTWATALPNRPNFKAVIKDPKQLRIIASNPRRYTGPERVGTVRELSKLCKLVQDNFENVTVPFLAVHGTEDDVAAPEGSKMLYEKAGSADKKLILYEGMYHSLVEGEPEENSRRVLNDMRAWIDARVKGIVTLMPRL